MNLKRILCLVTALLLAMSAAAWAETDDAGDLQAQLDAANARIAELEAQVAKYQPYYDSQVLAEFGEDGVVWLEDAQAQYEEAANVYAQYGISIDSYAAEIKQSIVQSLVQKAVLDAKTAELGIGELEDEVVASLNDEAAEDFETYVSYYSSYFSEDGMTEEESRAATVSGLADAGITQEAFLQDRIDDYVTEQLHDYVTADVTVDEADIQAEYEAMVAADQEEYEGDDSAYNAARTEGAAIAWNPEGYRAVKHVLVKFSDEQASQYDELESALNSLNDELAALDAAENADAGEAEEAAEEVAEEVEPPRTPEEIQADIGNVGVSIEALYSELLPTAQEVIDAFNAGTDIDTLIARYGGDPGMTSEPTATIGYAVAEGSTYWEAPFTQGAMSIAEIGQISEPVYGSNGIHIIYYMSDITPGPVPFEDIRETVEEEALEAKISKVYNDQVDAWIDEAGVVYHLDRF